jgi:Putative prokaryotic signal transducing protein
MADLLHPGSTSDDEDVREAPDDPGEFRVADSVPDSFEADLLSRALEEAGIPAIVHSPHSGVAGKIDSPVEVYNLLVPARDLNRARLLLADRRAALEADPEAAARAAEDAEEAEESTGISGERP